MDTHDHHDARKSQGSKLLAFINDQNNGHFQQQLIPAKTDGLLHHPTPSVALGVLGHPPLLQWLHCRESGGNLGNSLVQRLSFEQRQCLRGQRVHL